MVLEIREGRKGWGAHKRKTRMETDTSHTPNEKERVAKSLTDYIINIT